MTYQEAIKELGSFVGSEEWHDYMDGAHLPSCREYDGIVLSISIVYSRGKAEVITDINAMAEIKKKELTQKFKKR